MCVLQELLHGPVEDQTPPHDRLLLVGQEAHGEHTHHPAAHLLFQGDHLALSSLDPSLHPQEAGNREAPDISVEDPYREPAPGQSDGQVHRDRRLADAPLARGDGEDTCRGRDGGVRSVLTGLPARPCHDSGPLGRIHGGDAYLHRVHPVEGLDLAPHVALYLGPQRAGRHSQCHVDGDVAAAHVDGPHHPQVDDGVAELGVDHRTQALAHLVLTRRGLRGHVRAGPGFHW